MSCWRRKTEQIRIRIGSQVVQLIVWIIILVVCIIGNLLVFESGNTIYRRELCKADYFVFLCDFLVFQPYFATPLFLLALSATCREENRIQVIIRTKNRRKIWNQRVVRILVVSVLFSFFVIGSAVGFAGASSLVDYNWDNKNSLFAGKNGGAVCEAEWIDLTIVVLAALLVQFLLIFIQGMLYIWLQVIYSKQWVSWLICMGVVICRATMLSSYAEQGILQRLAMSWGKWYDMQMFFEKNLTQFIQESSLTMGIAMALIGIAGLYFSGLLLIKRKGFFHER